ncbi:MAG: hypothetical protein L0221_09025 [Chloroflexi bacterium]|nr:hypothetical protein [Chloroflexota bacterium]
MRRALAVGLSTLALVLSSIGGVGAFDPPRHVVDDDIVDTPLEVEALHDGVTDGTDSALQHGGPGGHLAASSMNVDLVGQLTVSGILPGRISDVGVLGNYAYLGAFNVPCAPAGAGGGVYVVDISDPSDPTEVGFIPTAAGSFVGEGVQALSLNTPAFKGDILVINNEICAITGTQIGGFSIFDITDPLNPVALVEGAGDVTPSPLSATNRIHSAFAWQQGRAAYVVIVDDEELADVDIFNITDPSAPVQVAEVGLANWPGAQDGQSAGFGAFPASFFHDVVVKKVQGNWLMLLSYWDAGYIVLNVNDPASPVFINDTTYAAVDPQVSGVPPEGNAHQAEWSHNNKFILATDEDFSPARISSFTSSAIGPVNRPATDSAFAPSVSSLPGSQMSGEVVHVGRGCPPGTPGVAAGDPYLASPAGKIALIERGACRFDNKVAWAQLNGAVGAIVFNTTAGGNAVLTMGGNNPVAATIDGSPVVTGTVITAPAVFVGRDSGLDMIAGTPPVTATAVGEFNGWGYLHLFDAATLTEIDTYAIAEALNPAFLRTQANPFGFGTLSIHEVATDRERNLGYISYYGGGFRVVSFGASGISEVGHYLDVGGNNFWGVQTHRLPADPTETDYILASDRDDGLWIFRYTGPLP